MDKCPKCGVELYSCRLGEDIAQMCPTRYCNWYGNLISCKDVHNQLAESERARKVLETALIERLTCRDCKLCNTNICTIGLGSSEHKHNPCSDFIPRDELDPLISTNPLPFPPFDVVNAEANK